MMIKTAFPTVNAPLAVNPTIIEVVTDELCTIAVASIPTKKATKGFVVIDISCSAKPVPNSLKEAPISLMLSKKTYIITIISIALMIIFFRSILIIFEQNKIIYFTYINYIVLEIFI